LEAIVDICSNIRTLEANSEATIAMTIITTTHHNNSQDLTNAIWDSLRMKKRNRNERTIFKAFFPSDQKRVG
jgi:hypothetical protein